ncbi:MAG: transcriptional regulator [Methanosphaera sp. rholeuAM270]|nr:MAG: transcriptional regulator [Methanosphaera sp. rholeuAM270]
MKTKIRYLRQEMGITQKDFAEKVGVSRQTINALENGKYNPSLLLAHKITQLLEKEHIEEVFILEQEETEEK